MKQAPSYDADHVNDSWDFEFQVAVSSHNIDFLFDWKIPNCYETN